MSVAATGTATASRALSIRGVTKRFQDMVAVDQVDLEGRPGEFLTLLGPSGCGKTTLLRMIAGLETPTSGQILLGERDITWLPPERRPLNMVFQRYALFPHLDVFENVAYGLRTAGVNGASVRRRVEEALDLVRMRDLAHRRVQQLSGGQGQRVAVARAIVNQPSVLLLDEPLGALDLQLRKHMQVELRAIQARLGTTFIYVTHDQEEALAMSHRVAVMCDGRVVQVGAPPEVYQHPTTRFVASFVGDGTLLACKVLEVGEGTAEVELLAGGTRTTARRPAASALQSGAHGTLMLRPEVVRVTSADAGRVRGVLQDVLFLGASHRHLVRLDDGVVAKADMPAPAGSTPGAAVGLSWDGAAGVLVADG